MSLKEERTERAVKVGYKAFENSFNCGQSTLAGLLEEFKADINVSDEEAKAMLKANSKTWGLGGTGDTCGTAQGPIHFFGYVYGQDLTADEFDSTDTMKVIKRVEVISEFVNRFKEHWGSTKCLDIHGQTMDGRNYDLNNAADLGKFIADGARDNCQIPVEYAIRTACDILLNDDGTIKER